MAKIANNLTELIGGTPLMKLAGYSRKYGLQREVVAKLESFNPAGSVKDRVGLAMIEDAEARGALKPGATIIEPTSGNTGVGQEGQDTRRRDSATVREPFQRPDTRTYYGQGNLDGYGRTSGRVCGGSRYGRHDLRCGARLEKA